MTNDLRGHSRAAVHRRRGIDGTPCVTREHRNDRTWIIEKALIAPALRVYSKRFIRELFNRRKKAAHIISLGSHEGENT